MAVSLTIGLIVIVAALNIARRSAAVMEKTPHAILKRGVDAQRDVFLGAVAHHRSIARLIGTMAGVGISYVYESLSTRACGHGECTRSLLPFVLRPLIPIVVVMAVLICFLATISPSRQAAKLSRRSAAILIGAWDHVSSSRSPRNGLRGRVRL